MNKLSQGIEFALPELSWREPNQSRPEQGCHWNVQPPKVNDEVWVAMTYRDSIIEEQFWAIYEHWTTHMNGMHNAPEDLEMMRLVHCKTISPYEADMRAVNYRTEHPGIFQVRCTETLSIDEIPNRFPANNEPFILDVNDELNKIRRIFKMRDFTVYEGSDEGGSWNYIATNKEPRRLVLYGLFVEYADKWEICNRPFEIIGDEESIIKKMAAKAQEPPPPAAFCRIDQRRTL